MSDTFYLTAAAHVHAIALALAAACVCWSAMLAGLSRWHWFCRVGLLCLPLVLLLPIRAYEPLILLFPLVIALAASAAALRSRWERELPLAPTTSIGRKSIRWTLSLRDSMLGMTVISIALGVLVQLPWLGLNLSWGGLLFDGMVLYSISLVCLGLIGLRGGLAWAVALFVGISTGIVFESTYGDGLRALYLIGVAGPQHLNWVPLGEFYLVFAAVLVLGLWLVRWCWSALEQPALLAQRRRIVGSLATITAAPVVALYIAMFVGPPAVDTFKIRNNSLPQLVEIAQQLDYLNLGEMTLEEIQQTFPQTSVPTQVEQLYQQSLRVVKQPGSVSLDGSLQANEQSLAVQETQLTLLRAMTRRWSREADASARNGNIRRAVDFNLANLRIGNYLARGGIRIHVHAANAIKSDALAHLSLLREQLPGDLIPVVIDVLRLLDAGEENPQLTIARDRYWTDIAQGWRNRLELVVQKVLGVPSTETAAFLALKQPLNREAVHRRLLATDLALRSFRQEHGEYPQSLVDLVPMRLDMLPRDPYTQQALIYRPVEFGYSLYSTGPDAQDDGGRIARYGGEHHQFIGLDWNLESVIRIGWRIPRGPRGPGFIRPRSRPTSAAGTAPQYGHWTIPPWQPARASERPDLVRLPANDAQ
jgi:hypothetical protein